jgi:transposase
MSPQRRHDLTDEGWEVLAPLLPPQRPRTGRPAKDHRTGLTGIRWVLRTGAPWRDLPARYGPGQTGSSRFRRWREAGIGQRVLTARQTDAAQDGALDDTLAMSDGRHVRAHQQAAGAAKTGGVIPPSGAVAGDLAANCSW